MAIELTFSPEIIMEVWEEWERTHPGKVASRDMSSEEFSEAMMDKVKSRAQIISDVRH